MKKIIGFILLLTISFNSFSQANEEDINALSIFSEYVKAKNYDAAFQPWMELRQRSPRFNSCLLYTSPSPRDLSTSRMPSSA